MENNNKRNYTRLLFIKFMKNINNDQHLFQPKEFIFDKTLIISRKIHLLKYLWYFDQNIYEENPENYEFIPQQNTYYLQIYTDLGKQNNNLIRVVYCDDNQVISATCLVIERYHFMSDQLKYYFISPHIISG